MSGLDDIGRPRDARNSINKGRAVMKIVALAQSSNSLLSLIHIHYEDLE